MDLRRAMGIATCLVPLLAAPAFGQVAPQQNSVWDRPPQQEPPCIGEFTRLREVTEKRAMAIRDASQRKADPKEACALFNAFSAAETKMIKYAVDNQVWCGIPAQIIDGMKKGQARTADIRTKVCRAAAAPARPAGPTLSDALTTPVPGSNNIKTGRGTFDTLTGSPLGNR